MTSYNIIIIKMWKFRNDDGILNQGRRKGKKKEKKRNKEEKLKKIKPLTRWLASI